MSNQAKFTLSYPQAVALIELCVTADGGCILTEDARRGAERILKVLGPRMVGSDRWRNRWLELENFLAGAEARVRRSAR